MASTLPDILRRNRGKTSPIEQPERAEHIAILSAWTAFEALSPQTYKSPEELGSSGTVSVIDLIECGIPWETGERAPEGQRFFYQIILGSIPMRRATEELVRCFGEDEEFNPRIRDKAAIASLLVDENGVIVNGKTVAVSSFSWALPLALQMRLHELGEWPGVELQIIEALDDILRRVDSNQNPVPISRSAIEEAYNFILSEFGLHESLVEPPSFILRIQQNLKAKKTPEASLLNSFLLRDLNRAATLLRNNQTPAGLRRYLAMSIPERTFDLLADHAALEKAVAPRMMPAVRWPSPGGHPLVLLQQAAVNLARAELAGGEGIIAVNGPPGTGKTTLLRDIVACSVLDRAVAMSAFDDPKNAFEGTGEKISIGAQAYFNIYALHGSLKGHEVLVASSNNKAVENVSKELPATKAIGRSIDELNYFKWMSDLLQQAPPKTDDGENIDSSEENVPSKESETWGLCAAVLGSSKNRRAFKNTFWWHKEFSFRNYLISVSESGSASADNNGEGVVDVAPAVKGFAPYEAKGHWIKAKAKFLSLKQEVDTELAVLENVRQCCLQLSATEAAIPTEEAARERLLKCKTQNEARIDNCHNAVQACSEAHEHRLKTLLWHRTHQPGFIARLFRTKQLMAWITTDEQLIAELSEADITLQNARVVLSLAKASLDGINLEIDKTAHRLRGLYQTIAQLTATITEHQHFLGERMIDKNFFRRGHVRTNLIAPWLPDSLHRKREDLFIAALALQKAFVDSAAQKILHNLSVLMEVFSGNLPAEKSQRQLLGDLWSTFFLVIPVVSSTFASIESMLGIMPVGSIGWLLVDEAGQSVPQAAVGAIMRARRSIIAGDPLQIPPVVTLPERLNAEICEFFKITKSVWAAPEASAQTLADRASRFQSSFRTEEGARLVGLPLLVHRRSQEPMFGIANRIAYDSQMVFAAGKVETGAIASVLKHSSWFDVDGKAITKWCPAEGDMVVSLFEQLACAGVKEPDIFIISPFKIVADELKKRLIRERNLFAQLGVDVKQWVESCVGTVHTFQGREADSVFLVLGAPSASHARARGWATDTPNILNVAVSRAKRNLYVIGSYSAWSRTGCARELSESIYRKEQKYDERIPRVLFNSLQ